ncbi:MAG: hypothetical protein JW894_13225, partial [Bacteroidales bacterium]|nr:hypothetical protein [Bacteroidales bacterium]
FSSILDKLKKSIISSLSGLNYQTICFLSNVRTGMFPITIGTEHKTIIFKNFYSLVSFLSISPAERLNLPDK